MMGARRVDVVLGASATINKIRADLELGCWSRSFRIHADCVFLGPDNVGQINAHVVVWRESHGRLGDISIIGVRVRRSD